MTEEEQIQRAALARRLGNPTTNIENITSVSGAQFLLNVNNRDGDIFAMPVRHITLSNPKYDVFNANIDITDQIFILTSIATFVKDDIANLVKMASVKLTISDNTRNNMIKRIDKAIKMLTEARDGFEKVGVTEESELRQASEESTVTED